MFEKIVLGSMIVLSFGGFLAIAVKICTMDVNSAENQFRMDKPDLWNEAHAK